MTKQASLLLNEPTIPIYPTLAKLIGINQAALIQQLHFLLNSTKAAKNKYNYVDGRWWVYNSYEEWQSDHFVWLSAGTIKRLFLEMEEAGFILSRQSVKSSTDRRKWYSIDYEAWEKYVAEHVSKQADASEQNETMDGTNCSDPGSSQNAPMNVSKCADDLSETPSENTADITTTASETEPAHAFPSSQLRHRFDWSIAQDPDGFARYANGKYIDKMSPEFPLAVQAIFDAWLNALKSLKRAPMMSEADLWEQHRAAAIAMAKFHTQPAVVTEFITAMYTGDDPFWRNIPTPMKLTSVANGLASWTQAPKKSTEPAAQDGQRYITGKYADFIEH